MKRKKIYTIILLFTIIGLIFTIGITYGKYATNAVWNYYLKSKGFYFNSDYLDSNSVTNVNNFWDGSSIYFNVRNNLNQSVITNYDINYEATCSLDSETSKHAECRLLDSSSNTVTRTLIGNNSCNNTTNDLVDVSTFDEEECNSKGYTWLQRISSTNLYFNIILTDSNYTLKDVTANIKVTSLFPYKKELNGTFILHKTGYLSSDISGKYLDNDTYGRLTVSNQSANSRKVRIGWETANLIFNDKSDVTLVSSTNDSDGYVNQIVVNIPSKSDISFTYYKKDNSMVYTINNFTVEEMA